MCEDHTNNPPKMPASIKKLLDDNDYRYHVYPFYGCVPDWFIAYKELAKAISEYFTIEESTD